MKKHCIVAGALGISGRALLEHLEKDETWDVTAISRRRPDFATRANFLALDLMSAEDCARALRDLSSVTHVFYGAHVRHADPTREAALNLQMLRNLVEGIEAASPRLSRVVLLHGTKWYGNHLGPFKTPAREDDPRHMPPNFYYDQQDWIAEHQKGKSWAWSALRPHCICGPAIGSPMSHLLGLCLYAAISRELGLPLCFPGAKGAFEAMYQFTDAALLAQAMVWAGTEPGCANEAFNMTNGEVERWCNLWPHLARQFGMEAGPVRTISLAKYMADKEPLWQQICARRGLEYHRMDELVDWSFLDWAYGADYDQVSCLGKARRAGWTASVDAREMFERQIGRLVEMRIIPGP
ncbi:SDR family oxidoreductase [Arvimicrobium flavum]|uniref:SDR family oxidoreductase n=1 Tax=Arvimicrobium flavum TaxID=3393320 RepID=UPI00237B8032|nr:SDR family oxidoreductase [Mesorhizobium shangrilense]